MDAKTGGPARQQPVTLVYQGQKYSIRDAARVFGVSANSIRWRWYRRKKGADPLFADMDDGDVIFGFYRRRREGLHEPPDDKAKAACVGAGLILGNGYTLGQAVAVAGADGAYQLLAKEEWTSNLIKQRAVAPLLGAALPGKSLQRMEIYALMAPPPGPAVLATLDALLPGQT